MYYGHLGTNQKYPDYQYVLIFLAIFMIKCHLGPQFRVWITQVWITLFSSVHINKFHSKLSTIGFPITYVGLTVRQNTGIFILTISISWLAYVE